MPSEVAWGEAEAKTKVGVETEAGAEARVEMEAEVETKAGTEAGVETEGEVETMAEMAGGDGGMDRDRSRGCTHEWEG